MYTIDEFEISQENFENGICGSILWIMKNYHVYTTANALKWIDNLKYDTEKEENWNELSSLSSEEILNYCWYYASTYLGYDNFPHDVLCGIMDEIIFKKLIDTLGDEIHKLIRE